MDSGHPTPVLSSPQPPASIRIASSHPAQMQWFSSMADVTFRWPSADSRLQMHAGAHIRQRLILHRHLYINIRIRIPAVLFLHSRYYSNHLPVFCLICRKCEAVTAILLFPSLDDRSLIGIVFLSDIQAVIRLAVRIYTDVGLSVLFLQLRLYDLWLLCLFPSLLTGSFLFCLRNCCLRIRSGRLCLLRISRLRCRLCGCRLFCCRCFPCCLRCFRLLCLWRLRLCRSLCRCSLRLRRFSLRLRRFGLRLL